jgi:hypothetical protein
MITVNLTEKELWQIIDVLSLHVQGDEELIPVYTKLMKLDTEGQQS